MKHFAAITALLIITLSITTKAFSDLWTRYLAGRYVASMGFDSRRELIWFATRNSGVFSFDGTKFKSFNEVTTDGGLVSDSLTSVHVDRNHELWFGALNRGVSRFNPDTNTWTRYTKDEGLVSNRIKAITGDQNGYIWIATGDNGVSCFDRKEQWTRYDTTNGLNGHKVLAVAVDGDNNKWFGLRQRGISVLKKDGDWRYFLTDKTIQAIFIDSETAWFGTTEGAYKLNINNGLNSSETPIRVDSPDDTINSITVDANGNIWFATNSGAARLDRSETHLRFFDSEAQLGPTIVNSVIRDDENNLWFGMDLQGVIKYSANWETFTFADGLESDIVEVITEDKKGQIWAGTDYGFSKFEGSSWQTHFFDDLDCFQQNYITAAAFDGSGGIWLGTLACGVMFAASEMDLENPIFYTKENTDDSLSSNFITDIAINGEEVWFATNGGLSLFSPKAMRRWDKWTVSDTGLIDNRLNSLAVDKDDLVWIGTLSGANRFNRKTWRQFNNRNGLKSWINDIKIDSRTGKIWFATNGNGVSIYDPKDDTLEILTEADGLADDFVNAIAFDTAGVWFGTSNGVSFLDFEGTWITLTTLDGLGGNVVKATLRGSDGRLWFGATLGSVTRYTRRSIVPKTFILNNFDVTASSRIEYQFIGSDFGTSTDQLRYAFKLDDQDYSEWTFDTFASFNVIETGPHTFFVKTLDKDGNVNDDSPATDIFYKIDSEKGISTSFVDTAFFSGDAIEVNLFWPPYQLPTTAEVTIQPVPYDSLEVPAVFAYDIKPLGLDIHKKGVLLSFAFPKALIDPDKKYSIHRDKPDPVILGGTVPDDPDTFRITTSIDRFGRYALRTRGASVQNATYAVKDSVNAQPRIFSPEGGGHGRETMLSFELPQSSHVRIRVYNLAGRLVDTICDEPLNAGVNAIAWNGTDRDGNTCPTGLYVFTVESSTLNATEKVMVLNR